MKKFWQNAWNTLNEVHASTTIILPIYDMSGGAWEYVMGNYNNTPSSPGFTSWGETRYYDNYTGTEARINRILGDATAETYGWNGDYVVFVGPNGPWFVRGGHYTDTTGVGVFGFGTGSGCTNSSNKLM